MNPQYSIRAFAKLIGVDQSTLCKFFKRERNFTWPTINRCLERLSAPEEVIQQFREDRFVLASDYTDIEEDQLNLLADWKCWATIEYLKIDPLATSKSIAAYFNISEEDVKDGIARMMRLGFLSEKDGVYKILRPNNSWYNNEKTSIARRELQKDLLTLSMKALNDVDVEQRYHGSLTVAIDKNKLPEIKEKFNTFQSDIGKYLQKSHDLTDVYQLTLSFFPLSFKAEE